MATSTVCDHLCAAASQIRVDGSPEHQPRRTIPNILDRRDLYLDEERDEEMVADARDELANGGKNE